MKNLNLVKKKEADRYFVRNKNYYKKKIVEEKIIDLIKINSIKANSILEIGCANGNKLNQYSKLCSSKNSYGVDLSKKAIKDGKQRYKNLKLLNISSIEIDKIKLNFDLIICGFFLYHLDRELIFKQFDLINKKLSINGLLLIWDFDPLFKHSNKDFNSKKLTTFKMNYDNFLVESGLFEVIYKLKYKTSSKDKKNFKSDSASLTLFRKIDFITKYPNNI
jgi:2-polyprenyl-3-methyl-5-hydroxy-6-metoxy-1,4-benzoquinol methylase